MLRTPYLIEELSSHKMYKRIEFAPKLVCPIRGWKDLAEQQNAPYACFRLLIPIDKPQKERKWEVEISGPTCDLVS